MKKILKFVLRHKIFSGLTIIAVGLIALYGYKAYAAGRPQATSYALGKTSKGTILATVSGTGQVSAVSQVDIKAKASGDIVAVYVKEGDTVKNGQLLAALDSTDAQKAVRDAQTNLETSQLSLKKLTDPVDELTRMQAEDTLKNAKDGKASAQDSLNKALNDAQNEIANAFLDFPDIVTGLKQNLYGNDASRQQGNMDFFADAAKNYDPQADLFRSSAASDYAAARAAYDQNFIAYKNTGRSSDEEAILSLLDETYATSKLISQAVLSANNLIQFYEDRLTEHGLEPLAVSNTLLSSLNGFTSKINSHISSLLGYQQSIKNYKQEIIDSDRTIAEKTISLDKVLSGADALDLRSAQINVDQKKNALADAKAALADYSIRAPFDGVLASFSLKKGDAISNGGTAATVITKQLSAVITLNEIDAVKVKVGQKATITFDAVDGLSLTGTVAQTDTLGTVSQGVVGYDATIVFDTQDERVRPGMSISVSIITSMAQDVLTVPSSAIKTANGISYVLVPAAEVTDLGNARTGVMLSPAPVSAEVVTGLSDGTNTEIVSGLSEGETIVVKTISAAGSSTNSSSSTSGNRNLFQATGGVRAGGFAQPGR